MATPPSVIAGLSANHNGDLQQALKLIDVAVVIGADVLKIQTYTADTLPIQNNTPDFQIKSGRWDGRMLRDLYQEAQTPCEWHATRYANQRRNGQSRAGVGLGEVACRLAAVCY